MRHSRRRKALLKHFPTPFPAQFSYSADCLDRILHAFNDEAGGTRLHKLGDRATAIRNDGRAAGHRLNHYQAEWLRPVDRKQQRVRIAQEFTFLDVADLAYEFHE